MDGTAISVGVDGTDASKVTYSNVIDQGKNGDDILDKLYIYLASTKKMVSNAAGASTLVIALESSSTETFDSVETTQALTASSITDAGTAVGTKIADFINFPHGLKRYIRLKFTLTPYDAADTKKFPTTAPEFFAAITDNRTQG